MEGPAAKYGINKIPAFIYFEDNIPTIYDEDPTDPKAIGEWIEEQRTSDTIEVAHIAHSGAKRLNWRNRRKG